MTTAGKTTQAPSHRRFLQLAELCEEQLLACKNGDIERIAQLLERKERLIGSIDFQEIDPNSEQMQRSAMRIVQCDSESAQALQLHHKRLGEALEKLRNGRTTRRAYAPNGQPSDTSVLFDRRE